MTTLDILPEVTCPPTDLWSDEPPLESDLHLQQIIILLSCLELLWQEKNDYYASGNLTIYYNEEQLKKRDFCGPDFFVVLDTEKRPRKSWVVWGEQGKYPNVIVEILSDSTANIDRNNKKILYQNTFRTPNYFWFDPNTLEFQGFTILEGQYQAISANDRGYLWSEQLGLYLGIFERKLRYFTVDGQLVPTPQEAELQQRQAKEQILLEKEQILLEKEQILLEKEQERQAKEQAFLEKEQERQAKEQALLEKEQERQAKERLAAKLRELGINPQTI
ncbi:MAG: Uma2 family endonuclease [Microcystis sp. M040S2]|uniref:Uma2 family endonuclease n=1 Tax=unclassified Microcystis TaxID=2643300 RepID=UPI00258E060B|nr:MULTISPECIES: Uma2 family endonuclease [unclassified Microcystis]MCA2926609.1 Uma2 family endonuclease [Microcystis sp. M020S1]MCA2936133.1 Uma2 family endonuclease [Microcystis sp. M015S1]MCA2621370.1 Uma2 family endonuclease [Microcystis sp. M099S2]MCA2649886.1 Uma2 family endonuclease [Microcystis sp. M065S2]MCA2679886.1 Uma2 family endonuclease [Microcystis sp. M043S2]